jgi:hypothetical protein
VTSSTPVKPYHGLKFESFLGNEAKTPFDVLKAKGKARHRRRGVEQSPFSATQMSYSNSGANDGSGAGPHM